MKKQLNINYKLIIGKGISKKEKDLLRNFLHNKINEYTVNEVETLLDVKNDELYNLLHKFQEKTIKFTDKELHFSYNILNEYEITQSLVILKFGNFLNNKLINKQNYLFPMLLLKESFSILFFELYCQDVEGSKKIKFFLDDLKDILKVGSYKRFYDFERFVLKPLILDINENTQFTLSYEKIKSGNSTNNKITAIKIIILDKNSYKNSKIAFELLDKINNYEDFNTAVSKIVDLLNKYPKENIENGIKKIKKNETIENHLENILLLNISKEEKLIFHERVQANNIISLQKIIFNQMEIFHERELLDNQVVKSAFNKKFYNLNKDKKFFFEIKNLSINVLELSKNNYDIKIFNKN